MKEKIEIWLSEYSYGEATVYAETESGEEISKATVIEGENYTATQLQKMLDLPTRARKLSAIAQEIYDHNRRQYERAKSSYARTWGWNRAEREYRNYPSFQNRMR